MVQCGKCGSEAQPNAFYCSNCGVPVREAGVGRTSSPALGLSSCIVLIIIGIVMFFIGVLLVLAGNYDYQRVGDWAGLIMMVSGLAVMVFSILLYKNIR